MLRLEEAECNDGSLCKCSYVFNNWSSKIELFSESKVPPRGFGTIELFRLGSCDLFSLSLPLSLLFVCVDIIFC